MYQLNDCQKKLIKELNNNSKLISLPMNYPPLNQQVDYSRGFP